MASIFGCLSCVLAAHYGHTELLNSLPGIGKLKPKNEDDAAYAIGGTGAVIRTPSGHLKVHSVLPGLSPGYFRIFGIDEHDIKRELRVHKKANLMWGINDYDPMISLTDPTSRMICLCNVNFDDDVIYTFGTDTYGLDRHTWVSQANLAAENDLSKILAGQNEITALKFVNQNKAVQKEIDRGEQTGLFNQAAYGKREHKQLIPKQPASTTDNDDDDDDSE